MKKIGLCISCNQANYGMLLQAFATQHVIDGLGYNTEIIEYSNGSDPHKRYTPGAFWQRNVVNKVAKLHVKRGDRLAEDEIHLNNKAIRFKEAEDFRAKYMHSFVKCEGFNHARELSRHYDAVLVGSDQVWNPRLATSNFYTLRFVDAGIKRISYATSMGVSTWPFYLRGEAKDYLSRIDSMSVREETAAKIIESLTGRMPQVVCDPTCLLTVGEWENIISPVTSAGSYILCYFLGESAEGKKCALKMREQIDLPIWGIMSNECVADESYFDRSIYGASVDAFVNLIRGATLILTDSFHGTMMSLIHKKPFYVFYRFRKDTPYQRNSRIDDALTRYNVSDRLVTNATSTEFKDMDYSEISRRMDSFRSSSMEFLMHALP